MRQRFLAKIGRRLILGVFILSMALMSCKDKSKADESSPSKDEKSQENSDDKGSSKGGKLDTINLKSMQEGQSITLTLELDHFGDGRDFDGSTAAKVASVFDKSDQMHVLVVKNEQLITMLAETKKGKSYKMTFEFKTSNNAPKLIGVLTAIE